MARIAVVGAGIAGLVVAGRLQPHHDVVVFDKSRGTGGRLATRYAGPYRFDHGAQYFTARTPEFKAFLEPLTDEGIVAIWNGPMVELRGDVVTNLNSHHDGPRYVGTPGMNAVGKALARDLDVRLETTIARLERTGDGWQLFDETGIDRGSFDVVVLAMPAAQTASVAPADSRLQRLASSTPMSACFTLMLGYASALDLGWHAARVRGADIGWISVNSSKPGRSDSYTLIAHSTNAYANAHLDDKRERIREHLLSELCRVTGADGRTAEHIQLHRWRYANACERSGSPYMLDLENRLAGCGDWFVKGRVEAAYTSGARLADALLTSV